MARVKRGVAAKRRHKKVLEQAKGYYGNKSRSFRAANEQLLHSGQYAFRDRRARTRQDVGRPGDGQDHVHARRRLVRSRRRQLRTSSTNSSRFTPFGNATSNSLQLASSLNEKAGDSNRPNRSSSSENPISLKGCSSHTMQRS